MPGKELLYLFEISNTGNNIKYVAWEKRDAFSGEDQATGKLFFTLVIENSVKATDIFGKKIDAKTSGGHVEINLSDTPVFIQRKVIVDFIEC